MRKLLAALALFALALLVARPAVALEAMTLDEGFEERPLGMHVELAHDPTGALTVDEVVAGRVAFTASTNEVPNFGFRPGIEWLRVRIADRRARGGALVIEHGYPATDEIALFEVEGTRVTPLGRGGDHVPPGEWNTLARLAAIEFPSKPEQELYLRVATTSSKQLSFRLFSSRAYEAHRRADLVAQAAYFGALAAMFLYNVLLWVATRTATYGFYVAFLGAFAGYQTFFSGFGPMLLGSYGVWCDRAVPIGIGTFGWLCLEFAVRLLDVDAFAPALARRVRRLAVAYVCLVVAATLFRYRLGVLTAFGLGAICLVTMLALAIMAHRRGVTVARLYLAAWAALMVGLAINIGKSLGALPINLFTANAAQAGSALEFLLLSFALADRIKRLQAEARHQADRAREATERALAEQERTNEELTRLDALKDEFLANTSHELRTPLNGVIGIADSLLANDQELSKIAAQGLRAILASGKRLDRLVSDVLDFRKARSGDLAIELGPVDLAVATSEALLLLAPTVGAKNLRLANDVPQSFPLARADETRLAQVLQHVVGNAIKFTESGEIRVGAERREGRLVLRVRDTGPGIPAEKLATLFNPFEQGDGSATRAYGGTGLGLAFVKQLMVLQGGAIDVVETGPGGTVVALDLLLAPPAAQAARLGAGKGTTVRTIPPPAMRPGVTALPRRDDPVEPRTPLVEASSSASALRGAARRASDVTAAPATGGPKAIRVLVADDERVNLERMRMDLEPAGYELVCVDDGEAAIEAFEREGPFDLVLLDVMMPRVDGLGACRAIRARVSAAEVPVLLVTAKREAKDLQAGFAAGANDYVTKPYARQELLERVRAHLSTSRTARALGRFVPGEFAKLLGYQRLDELRLGDCAEKELAVLFLDIHGFTSISERMTPRQVFEWLNDQFRVLVPAVRAHGGFVDKFVGDALMGIFPKGALPAVSAATEAMRVLRAREPTARVGIGIHHGSTMIGAIGDDERFSPTVVSDTVNVASRLESLTRRFDALVLLSNEALQAAGIARGDRTRYLGAFRVKGRGKAIGIHELLDAEDPFIAAEKRGAAEYLLGASAELERGDVDAAFAIVGAACARFPVDPVLAFYRETLGVMLQTGTAFEGAFELGDK